MSQQVLLTIHYFQIYISSFLQGAWGGVHETSFLLSTQQSFEVD